MSSKQPSWGKPNKKEESPKKKAVAEKPSVAAAASSWTPPSWKSFDQVTFHLNKHRENPSFMQGAAAHFGVEYSSDVEATINAILSEAKNHF